MPLKLPTLVADVPFPEVLLDQALAYLPLLCKSELGWEDNLLPEWLAVKGENVVVQMEQDIAVQEAGCCSEVLDALGAFSWGSTAWGKNRVAGKGVKCEVAKTPNVALQNWVVASLVCLDYQVCSFLLSSCYLFAVCQAVALLVLKSNIVLVIKKQR